MKKYNTMCDVGYTVLHDHEDPHDITVDEHIEALKRRLHYLRNHPGDAVEAFGICDTYEVLQKVEADPLDSSWKKVVFSVDCDEDGNCPNCEIDFADCPCPGPTQDGYEYREFNGVLYARKTSE